MEDNYGLFAGSFIAQSSSSSAVFEVPDNAIEAWMDYIISGDMAPEDTCKITLGKSNNNIDFFPGEAAESQGSPNDGSIRLNPIEHWVVVDFVHNGTYTVDVTLRVIS